MKLRWPSPCRLIFKSHASSPSILRPNVNLAYECKFPSPLPSSAFIKLPPNIIPPLFQLSMLEIQMLPLHAMRFKCFRPATILLRCHRCSSNPLNSAFAHNSTHTLLFHNRSPLKIVLMPLLLCCYIWANNNQCDCIITTPSSDLIWRMSCPPLLSHLHFQHMIIVQSVLMSSPVTRPPTT